MATKVAGKQRIRLRGTNGAADGKAWESTNVLRAGRLDSLEIVLDDPSVSRRHAEIRSSPEGWQLRDLDSTNGTFLNGTRVATCECPLQPRDVIQFGKITVVVEALDEAPQACIR